MPFPNIHEAEMIFACEYCGGIIEPAIIAGAIAAWGWSAYLLSRIFGWLRRK